MGKKKDKDKEYGSERKKLKKHKKHKKKRDRALSDTEEIDVVNDEISQDEGKGVKLKIKFAGEILLNTEVVTTNLPEEDINVDYDDDEKSNENELSFNSGISSTYDMAEAEDENTTGGQVAKSEDEQWLEALEKGELDETGAVKKEKDITAMTARQRALHGETIEGEDQLLQLPMYPEKTEEENEEFERKRKLRAKKRKQQMQEQIEETKMQTVEKLLTKGQKSKKETTRTQKRNGPYYRYTDNKNGIFISCDPELDFPLTKRSVLREPPPAIMCCVDGCNNQKKYNCSKRNVPVCSLQCYKMIQNYYDYQCIA